GRDDFDTSQEPVTQPQVLFVSRLLWRGPAGRAWRCLAGALMRTWLGFPSVWLRSAWRPIRKRLPLGASAACLLHAHIEAVHRMNLPTGEPVRVVGGREALLTANLVVGVIHKLPRHPNQRGVANLVEVGYSPACRPVMGHHLCSVALAFVGSR